MKNKESGKKFCLFFFVTNIINIKLIVKNKKMNNHEIDYKIHGEELQCVEIELDPQEAVISEPGSFMMMTDGIQMETLFGDGTETGG